MADVFILGAGFSKALNERMPTMDELGKDVKTRLEKVAEQPKSAINIPQVMTDFGTNIEYWISYLSQPQPWLRQEIYQSNLSLAGAVRNAIRDAIDQRTTDAMGDSPPAWADDLVSQWHNNQVPVITLNYDTLIESICGRGIFSVASSQSSWVGLSQIYPRYLANIKSRTGVGWSSDTNWPSFLYRKLHGSINWFYSGMSSFYGETIYYSDVLRWSGQIKGQRLRRPPEARDKDYLIIPPVNDKLTYFNNESIRQLWQEAGEALWGATRVIIIGYSLPPSDLGMRFFLQSRQPDGRVPIYIVDKEEVVVERYRQLLPRQDVIGDYAGSDTAVEDFVSRYPNDL